MRILLFDTETNGLPKNFNASPYATNNWPIIISIAWQLYNIDNTGYRKLESGERIVKPGDSVVWDEEAVKFHGITKERALAEGTPGSVVFPAFMKLASTANVIVAHNISFDKSVLLAELIRLNPSMTMDWWPRFEYCTCNGTTALCKLPAKNPKPHDPYKKPRLVELWEFLFEKKADFEFHTAAADVECMVQCFKELVRRRLVPLDVWARSLHV